jgi:hypothetical protein
MGILGASSVMKQDPARFCETFTLNWNGAEQGKVALLIDAMSLLHYLASSSARSDYLDLATIRQGTSEYTKSLLKVVGSQGMVHFFFDGLSPKAKYASQIKRYTRQAGIAEKMAKGELPAAKDRIIHHLAQWAFQEAIEEMIQETLPFAQTRLFIHRPRNGEGEALINHWIAQNGSFFTKIGIISEDSDFLIYDSCPGFIPPRSIKIEVHNDMYCLQGQLFSRVKFLKAFFAGIPNVDRFTMATLATLAGCDYTFPSRNEQLLDQLRRRIIQSDIGGLRIKNRNNPTAATSFTAIARSMSHYMNQAGPNNFWIDIFLIANCEEPTAIKSMIKQTLKIYYDELELSSDDQNEDRSPVMVDVRRLLVHGVIYCYPVAEETMGQEIVNSERKDRNLKKRDRNGSLADSSVVNTSAYAIVPLPPVSTQIDHWMNQSSMWLFPHFRQVRARLYVIIHNYIKVKGSKRIRTFNMGCSWTKEDYSAFVVEYVREGKGSQVKMGDRYIKVPHHNTVSSGLQPAMLNDADETEVMERWIILCVLGTTKLLPGPKLEAANLYGLGLLSSLMLPFNLAALTILMTTAPRLDSFKISSSVHEDTTDEVDLMLPLVSIAVHHTMLVFKTLAQLFPNSESRLFGNKAVSDMFDYKIVVMLWDSIRLGRNLEDLPDQECFSALDDQNIIGYLNDCFKALVRFKANDPQWSETLKQWKMRAEPLWALWWHVFSLDDLKEP